MNPNLTIILQIISSSKPVSLFRRLCSDFLLHFENGLIAPSELITVLKGSF